MFTVFRALSTVARGIFICAYSTLNMFFPNSDLTKTLKTECIDQWEALKEKDIETDKRNAEKIEGALSIFIFSLRNLFRS